VLIQLDKIVVGKSPESVSLSQVTSGGCRGGIFFRGEEINDLIGFGYNGIINCPVY
jgi:hypothetical protein